MDFRILRASPSSARDSAVVRVRRAAAPRATPKQRAACARLGRRCVMLSLLGIGGAASTCLSRFSLGGIRAEALLGFALKSRAVNPETSCVRRRRCDHVVFVIAIGAGGEVVGRYDTGSCPQAGETTRQAGGHGGE